MRRRAFLSLGATGGILLIAGCTGGKPDTEATSPPTPDEETSPSELLPEPPNGWQRTNTREIGDGFQSDSGIETGQSGTYTPDGETGYRVGVYRFASKADATDSAAQIEEQGEVLNWIYAVQRKNFILVGIHSDGTDGNLQSLLAASPILTEQYITDHNLL